MFLQADQNTTYVGVDATVDQTNSFLFLFFVQKCIFSSYRGQQIENMDLLARLIVEPVRDGSSFLARFLSMRSSDRQALGKRHGRPQPGRHVDSRQVSGPVGDFHSPDAYLRQPRPN